MKRLLVTVLLLAIALTGISAAAQQELGLEEETYVFKYAHTQTPSHPRSVSMEFFKE